MTNWIERAQEQLSTHAQTLHGIELIGKLLKNALVDPNTDTFAVIQLAEKIISTLISGFDGKIDSTEIAKQLDVLKASLLSNDEAADTALAEKFGRQT
jgi:hypothetical protein